jgi:hypothetical protein
MDVHDKKDAQRYLVQQFIENLCFAFEQRQQLERDSDEVFSTMKIRIPSRDTIDALLDANRIYQATAGKRRILDRVGKFELVRTIIDDLERGPQKKVTQAIRDAAARFGISYELARRTYYDKNIKFFADTREVYKLRKLRGW